jgi:hypothetical protein
MARVVVLAEDPHLLPTKRDIVLRISSVYSVASVG